MADTLKEKQKNLTPAQQENLRGMKAEMVILAGRLNALVEALDVPEDVDEAEYAASLRSDLQRVTEERDRALASSREKIHRAFLRERSPEGACQCPYCTGDGEMLAEMVAEYELDMFAAQQKAQTAEAALQRLTAEQACGERVFEAVVYAFEGKEVPPDLANHGMVSRGRKHYARLTAEQETRGWQPMVYQENGKWWRLACDHDGEFGPFDSEKSAWLHLATDVNGRVLVKVNPPPEGQA